MRLNLMRIDRSLVRKRKNERGSCNLISNGVLLNGRCPEGDLVRN